MAILLPSLVLCACLGCQSSLQAQFSRAGNSLLTVSQPWLLPEHNTPHRKTVQPHPCASLLKNEHSAWSFLPQTPATSYQHWIVSANNFLYFFLLFLCIFQTRSASACLGLILCTASNVHFVISRKLLQGPRAAKQASGSAAADSGNKAVRTLARMPCWNE